MRRSRGADGGRVAAGTPEEIRALWPRFRSSRDPELREALIRHYIGLVRLVAGRLLLRLPPHVSQDDLEGAGVPGLVAAIETYDPEKGVDFATYARRRIRGAILDELRDLDPLPRSLRHKGRRIERAIAILEQRLLRAPTHEEVADFLGMPLSALDHTLHDLRGGLQVPLDAGWPGGDEDEGENGGRPPVPDGTTPSPWQALAIKERRSLLGAILEELPAPERLVLSLYYYEELTMKEIGAVLEVSESRVSQIHSAALLRIRARLRRRKLGSEDLHVDERRQAEPSGFVRAIP